MIRFAVRPMVIALALAPMAAGARTIVPATQPAGVALAGGGAGAAHAAATPHVDASKQLRINLAWQVALDGAHFSPGIIDGNFGKHGHMALKEYAAAHFPGVDAFDPQVYAALKVDVDHAVAEYVVADADVAEVGPLPEDWNEKAKLDRLPYESLLDCLAEKFHCTKALLEHLNPGLHLSQLNVGGSIHVPNISPFPGAGPLTLTTRPAGAPIVDNISINLTEKAIRLYDKNDTQLALFFCSVAKDKAKLPARDTVVKTMAEPPEYTFDPKNWPEVTNVDHILTIPRGPRNPVGLAWIGLDLPGYGIHGNPKPELIGKTGSHGCFRMTNWDALALYPMVHTGMKVKIVNPEKDNATALDQ